MNNGKATPRPDYESNFILILLGVYLILIIFSPDFILGELPTHDIEFRLSDVFLVGLVCYLLLRLKKGEVKFFRPTVFYPGVIYILAYFIGVAVAFANDGVLSGAQASFFAIKHLEYFLIFIVVVNLVDYPRQVSLLNNLFLVGSFLVGTWLIISGFMDAVNLSFSIQLPDFKLIFHHAHSSRITMPFAQGFGPSGEFMELAIPLAVFSFLSLKWDCKKILYLLLTMVLVVGFLFTQSRGPIVSLALAFIGIGVIFERRLLWWLLLAFVVIGFLTLIVPEIGDRLLTLKRIATQGICVDRSLCKRVYEIWPQGMHRFLQNPIFGGGLASFSNDDTQYIRMLANQGIIGFGAFTAFIIAIFVSLNKIRKMFRSGFPMVFKVLSISLIVSTTSLLINGFTATSFQPVRAMEPFWFLLGLTHIGEKVRNDSNLRQGEDKC